jgi:hypothetical protein
VQVLDAQQLQGGQAGDGAERALAHGEEVVAMLDMQLRQCVPHHAEHHAKVRHCEVVLLLQIHKVALVCTQHSTSGHLVLMWGI